MYHIDPAYVQRVPHVYLRHVSGSSEEFESLEAFCRERGFKWVKLNVGEHFGVTIKIVTRPAQWRGWRNFYRPELCHFVPAAYILRSEASDIITQDNVLSVQYSMSFREWNGTGTGHKKAWAWDRRFSTQNELRQALANEDEGEPPIKPRRNRNHIPDSWNERSRHNEKNWKHQSNRKRQYKLE